MWQSLMIGLFGLVSLLGFSWGFAAEMTNGEAIILAQSESGGAYEQVGRAQREAARSQSKIPLPASAVYVQQPDDEGLFPQHGDDSLPDGKAREQKNSAKQHQSNEGALSVRDINDGLLDQNSELAAREALAGNVSKARAYMKNRTGQRVADLPVVLCDDVANVNGRIGDDSRSGSIITVLQNGKPVRARCK